MSPNRFIGLTIAVVEDHDDARTSLGLFLKHLGANVVLARNAFEGIEAVKNSRPNLVLSDISMPDRDGRILGAAFQACLPKPFTVDELIEAISNVLND
jgi:DNA-binding response OmpR family regulator